MTTAHATLAPSSAHRWGPRGCPGSVTMEQRYPQPDDTDEAREGTAAHWYVSETLQGRVVQVGDFAPNGVPVDVDMVEHGQLLIDAVPPGVTLRIEERVDMSESVHPENNGTPDVYALDMPARVAHVVDYKYGHMGVNIYKCWQLIDYACGVLECNGVPLDQWSGWRINVTIVQPRAYVPSGPVRSWSFGGQALQEYAAALKRAAYEALAPGAELRTGDHCRDCSARIHCAAYQAVVGNSLDVACGQSPAEMDVPAAATMRVIVQHAIARLKAMDTGLAALMEATIRNGGSVPGWEPEYVDSRERWNVPVEQVISAIRLMCDVDISKPGAMTPAQARKAKVDQAVIAMYAEKPRGAMRVVRVDPTDYQRQLGAR